ncbi:hypothetical protein SAMN02745216_02989 [Desulfatibacillum alkenivorans DSM 16219]|jgi:hypothetical protein|uniref:DUF6915 domain-containing protein n=1 Tax=Desulfatibacillum alkenivorans DSM 16219 TaxID=1121393 RepID=A0A1M6Q7P5_9BACT|nr:hypothetical protein [Desulfatibacillum alkenivorans]SHK16314.1 hypothetical protein SAMN02745216_02989 [Desulfatibacillum alkenivorans DSM 16219]
MKCSDHCAESIKLFGKPFEEVHLWLDEFAGSPEYGMRHRKVRHHEQGIQKAIRLFGEEAGLVARQHIISDLKEEGWTENDPFPKDEADYVRMGLF